MMHWRARRSLAALPDGTLEASQERRVRAHLRSCRRCQRELAEIERCEGLLQRLPLSVAPLDVGPGGYRRLVRLGCWSEDPELPQPGRWRAPVLGMATLAALMALTFSMRAWAPVLRDAAPIRMALLPADHTALPVGWRPGH